MGAPSRSSGQESRGTRVVCNLVIGAAEMNPFEGLLSDFMSLTGNFVIKFPYRVSLSRLEFVWEVRLGGLFYRESLKEY